MLDGSTIKQEWAVSTTIGAIFEWVASMLPEPDVPFTLLMPFPRREFSEDSFNLTLQQAGMSVRRLPDSFLISSRPQSSFPQIFARGAHSPSLRMTIEELFEKAKVG